MSLHDQLTSACLSGPRALQTLIKAKGMQLAFEVDVLREVLSAVVFKGAPPKVLAVLEEHLKELNHRQKDGNTVNAITELINIESDLRFEYSTETKEYSLRKPDPALRKSIAAAVKEALRLMPNFNLKERITFRTFTDYIPQHVAGRSAFYVYEALMLPLGPFVEEFIVPQGYYLSHSVALETLGRLIESSPTHELEAVYAKLPNNVQPDDKDYHSAIVKLKADLKKRIQSKKQWAMFLTIYNPVIGITNGRRTIMTNAFPVELFRRIVKMVFD